MAAARSMFRMMSYRAGGGGRGSPDAFSHTGTLGLVDVPGKQRRHDGGREEGHRQRYQNRTLDAIAPPPQFVPAENQPYQA
jgi:hypothetical protein